MSDALVVHVNRSTHHTIEPASESFETDGPFVVQLRNHGEGCHVHCSLEGELAGVASVTDDNPFLEPDGVVELPVEVGTDLRPARGTLEVSTGYGRESVAIDVLVRESGAVPTSPISRESGDDGNGTGSTSRASTGDASATAPAGSGSVTDGWSLPASVSSDAIEDALARPEPATVLLAVLAALAVVIAYGAWQLLEGPAVLLAVLVVIATVLGAAVALLRG